MCFNLPAGFACVFLGRNLREFWVYQRKNMLTFEDFKKVKLVSAKILEAKEHPDADRLYVLKIDLGEEQRQLVAGIRNAYSTDDLIGKKIIVVANLEPATIRGVESQGMLLAVSDGKGASLVQADRDVALGCTVK